MVGWIGRITPTHDMTKFFYELTMANYKLLNLMTAIKSSEKKLDKRNKARRKIKEMDARLSEDHRKRFGFSKEGLEIPPNTPEDLLQFELQTKLILSFVYFETYIYQCLNYVFNKYPKMIKDKQITVADFVEKDKSDLLQEIIDQVIQEIMRGNVSKIIKELTRKGINCDFDEENKNRIQHLDELWEVRNLYVHNNGVINSIFQKRTGRTDLPKGSKLTLDRQWMGQVWHELERLAEVIDICLIQQFPVIPMYEQDNESSID